MTSSQLISHTNLTLLGNINLCHLQDTRGKFIANGDGKLLALHLGIKQFVLLHIIDNQLADEIIGMIVVGPVADLDVSILQVLEIGDSEFGSTGDNLGTGIVLDSL